MQDAAQTISDMIQVFIQDIQHCKDEKSLLHSLRMKLEPIVFGHLIRNNLPRLKEWWATYKLPLSNQTNKCVVIYETRILPQLEFHILNTCYYAQGWSLLIYCTNDNIEEIKRILGPNWNRAILHLVPNTDKGRVVYNKFYKTLEFWSSIPAEFALCAEIDSYIRHPLPDTIDYDLICSVWPWNKELPGGGGLTIRRVPSMIRICSELPHLMEHVSDQDYWATKGAVELGMRINNTMLVEAHHEVPDPIGLHQWWTFFKPIEQYLNGGRYQEYLTLK